MKMVQLSRGAQIAVLFNTIHLVMLVNINIYLGISGSINAETIFMCLAWYLSMQKNLMRRLPTAVMAVAESVVSCTRLQVLSIL